MVGLAGFEPTTFTRNQLIFLVPTGFFNAPEPLHPNKVRKPVFTSGALNG